MCRSQNCLSKMNLYREHNLAKISGITLEQHSEDVMSEAAYICASQPNTLIKYKRSIGKDLDKRLAVACRFHDDGKMERHWQEACRRDAKEYSQWLESNPDGNLREYDKMCHGESGKNIRQCGVRHELFSLFYNENKHLPLPLQVAIAAHHGKISQKFRERWVQMGFKNLWNVIERKSNEIIESDNLQNTARMLYEYDGVRGLLQMADHRASAKEENDFVPPLHQFSYQFPFTEKRGVQLLVEHHWQEEMILLRAPTGAGKTDAALLWASKQIESHRAQRVVIAMPTRFTSNALAINVADTLSGTGLYHSSAWFLEYAEKIKQNGKDRISALKLLEQARLLECPITVCTIDHLLISLTQTREDMHLTNFNLANSCLVIDEADFYDNFTQQNIFFLLRVLHLWKVPVLIMSASLPESVLTDYRKTGYPISSILEDDSDYSRIRFEITQIRDYSDVDEVEDILEHMIHIGNGIVYANTVDRAVEFYHHIMNKVQNIEEPLNVILYHSRFTEPDKQKIESKLLDALGKEAWKHHTARGIAILTQIGEMSVNISADIMVSEICPIDRLTQRAGRLCRFDHSKVGRLILLKRYKNDKLYPAPYGHFERKEKTWTACAALSETIKLIKADKYNAAELVDLINKVYARKSEEDILAKQNAALLRENFIDNWLICPTQKSELDDTDTNLWKSRDISAQDTVYVKKPDLLSFRNYSDFMEFKLLNGISIPVYLIEKCRKMHRIDLFKIKIGDAQCEYIDVIRPGFYDNYVGIDMSDPDNFL